MNLLLGSFFSIAGITFIIASYWLGYYAIGYESPLATLYIQGAISSIFESGIFFIVSAIGFLSLMIPSIRHYIYLSLTHMRQYFVTLTVHRQHITIFLICITFILALNTAGVNNGYFHSDDFKVLAENNSHTTTELFWLPYSDHLLPLYRMEVLLLFNLFDVNPVPYNIFLLLLAATVLFSVYMLLRSLKFPLHAFFIFLVLYGGSTFMGEFLSGFYMVSMYPQIIALFVFAMWAYVKWFAEVGKRKRQLYLLTFSVLLASAIFLDIAGVWVLPAFLVFSYFHTVSIKSSWSPMLYLQAHVPILSAVFAIGISFIAYAFTVFSSHPESFLLGNSSQSALSLIKNFYDVITSGVIAQIFAPSAGLILSQPRFAILLSLWTILMVLCFAGFAAFVYWAIRTEDGKYRPYIYGFLLILLGVSILPAIGRPSGHVAAFFPVQQIIMSFFWYTFLLSIIIAGYLKTNYEKRIVIIVALCVFVLGWQHMFAFYNDDNLTQVLDSRRSVERLQTMLVPAINKLSSESKNVLTIPELRGAYINPYVFGNDILKYSAFLDFDSSITFISARHGPYRASTSPEFIESLSLDENIGAIYLAQIELEETYRNAPIYIQPTGQTFKSDGAHNLMLSPHVIDPQETSVLSLDITVPTESEKVFVDVAFKNDFGIIKPVATVRLDQFSKPITEERRFALDIDLNQVYAFALSKNVSDFSLTFATPGTYVLHGYRFSNYPAP